MKFMNLFTKKKTQEIQKNKLKTCYTDQPNEECSSVENIRRLQREIKEKQNDPKYKIMTTRKFIDIKTNKIPLCVKFGLDENYLKRTIYEFLQIRDTFGENLFNEFIQCAIEFNNMRKEEKELQNELYGLKLQLEEEKQKLGIE